MTHRKRSHWLSLGSLPILSGLVVSGLGCTPRDDIAEPAAEGGGGNSGSAGDDGTGGNAATGGTTSTGGSSGKAGGTSSSGGTATGGAPGTGGAPNCVNRERGGVIYSDNVRTDGVICAPSGFPYVQFASAVAVDDTTVSVRQPRPGTLCLSGATSTANAIGVLALHFSSKNVAATEVLSTFDADALGITAIAFTVASPPAQGLSLHAQTTTQLSCPEHPLDCLSSSPGFNLMTGPDSSTPLTISLPERITAPFANFERTNGAAQEFDTTLLDLVGFDAGSGTYDFCISDFQFLDADGNDVRP
jgi:hypothetical protein